MSDATAIAGEGPATTAGPRSDASRVRRLPQRAAYDEASINAVLDESLMGHVGFVAGGRPVVIPMLYGRDGSTLYLHGSVASRLLRSLAGGIDMCLTVTIVDGLVLARSAFHHSMNYRSVVAFGRATLATGEDKRHGLRVISEHLAPGRWDEVREPSDLELRQTSVLRMEIVEASAKARTGGPIDDEEDLDLPMWAGVLPCGLAWGEPVTDALVPDDRPVSPSVLARRNGH
jgi:nitroimidazol reductase NimA-like FMN-containing flavoprotein (pyridoxamine 5'-phosphate oxidase superfamily)